MARVKRAVNAQKKRRTVLESASGYRGQRSRLYRKAKEQMLHSMQYAYRDRRDRKGDFRQLWITRINAGARANGMTYNRMIQGLKLAGVEVDRKILADMAVNDAAAFAAIVEIARKARAGRGHRRRRGSGRVSTTSSTYAARGRSVHATDPPGCCCPAPAAPARSRHSRACSWPKAPRRYARPWPARRSWSSCSRPTTRSTGITRSDQRRPRCRGHAVARSPTTAWPRSPRP